MMVFSRQLRLRSFLVSVVVLLHSLAAVVHGRGLKNANQGSLFKESDPLLILNADNFEHLVYGKDSATLIDFYANWCGHCQRFAPKYVRFARDVLAWKKVMQVAAVDCGHERNIALCRDQQVLAFPSLKLYPAKFKRGERAFDVNFRDMTPTSVRNATLNSLVGLAMQTRPSGWPDFMPLNASNKAHLLEQMTQLDSKPTLLIVEEDDSQLGNEVILDLSAYTHLVGIFRVLVGHNRKLVSELLPNPDDVQLPALLRVTRRASGVGGAASSEIDLLDSVTSGDLATSKREAFVKRIAEDFLDDSWTSPDAWTRPLLSDSPAPAANNLTVSQLTPVHYADLYNALRYSLYHEVLMHTEFNGSQVQALRRFYTVLHAYFPFDNENPRRFVKRMAQWFNAPRNATDSKDLHAIMRAGSEGFIPTTRPWQACSGSQKHLRGYPCGLWLLFHVLTVSEYSKSPAESVVADYHSVLFAMRDYVSNFFGCKTCAEHFVEMAADMGTQLRYPNSSVLWLWEAHNKVNERIKGDATEDPVHPKVQFPTSEQCPDCMRGGGSDWDKPAVLKFLVNHYHKANIIRNASSTVHLSSLSLIAIFIHFIANFNSSYFN